MSDRETFLHSDDLIKDGAWTQATVTVAAVIEPNTVKAQGALLDKICLQFKESPKLLILNATMTRIMRILTGTEKNDGWIGQRVTVYAAQLEKAFGETNVSCIRLRPPENFPLPMGVRKHMGKDLTGNTI